MSTAIVWFRRDLRVHDHPALTTAVREYERVVPLFVFDPALLSERRYSSPNRLWFMLGCLRELDRQLAQRGSRLVVRHGDPRRVVATLAHESGADAVLWTSDVSPYARARDRLVTDALREAGVRARPHGGNYVVDVSSVRTAGGQPYRVFSPFHRAWLRAPRRDLAPAPAGRLAALPEPLRARMPELELHGGRVPDCVLVRAGEQAARQAASRWLNEGLDRYGDRHDQLSGDGTSLLSPYLRWGCLSSRELEARAVEHGGEGARAWVRQLCWRDFYAHVLLHHPANVDSELQPRLRGLRYDYDEELLEAWQHGQTGYPVVDAGMRQLVATGWMHNRARLIVGSFLTKDLQLDWRAGERWFAEHLLDGEPAQNNGNWQWIASVGTDPAPPSRRMYNPSLQAGRFDPDGAYVRRWVPELAGVPLERLVEPWTMSASEQRRAGCRIGVDYPETVVEHRSARRRALERYRATAVGVVT